MTRIEDFAAHSFGWSAASCGSHYFDFAGLFIANSSCQTYCESWLKSSSKGCFHRGSSLISSSKTAHWC